MHGRSSDFVSASRCLPRVVQPSSGDGIACGSIVKLTAAGLFRTLTWFPFNRLGRYAPHEPMRHKDKAIFWICKEICEQNLCPCFAKHLNTSQMVFIRLCISRLWVWSVTENTSPLFTLLGLSLFLVYFYVKCCEVFSVTLHALYLLIMNKLSVICEVWRLKSRVRIAIDEITFRRALGYGYPCLRLRLDFCACAQKKLFLCTPTSFL